MVQVARSADGLDCSITVRPNSALPRRGGGPCLFLYSLSTGALAGLFWLLGAWAVAAFLLVAMVALSVAFVVAHRDAGRFERLIFHDRLLRIESHDHQRDRIQEVNACWVRMIRPEQGHTGGVALRVHGHRLRFGRFLAPREQRRLARLVAGELARLEH